MQSNLLLLLVCYAVLATLLLGLCLYTRWSFWIKTTAIVVVTGFYFLTFDALAALLGFPTPGQLPDRFMFHYAIVVQPNKSKGENGAIFLWASTLEGGRAARNPRAYELPFDKETYNRLTEAQRRAKEGIIQMGSLQGATPREGITSFTRYLSSSNSVKLKFTDLPEPALPEK